MDAMEDMDILTGSNPVINNGILIIIINNNNGILIIIINNNNGIIIIMTIMKMISQTLPSTGPQHHPFIPGSEAVSCQNENFITA